MIQYFPHPQPSDHEDPWVSTALFLREGKAEACFPWTLTELGTRLCPYRRVDRGTLYVWGVGGF